MKKPEAEGDFFQDWDKLQEQRRKEEAARKRQKSRRVRGDEDWFGEEEEQTGKGNAPVKTLLKKGAPVLLALCIAFFGYLAYGDSGEEPVELYVPETTEETQAATVVPPLVQIPTVPVVEEITETQPVQYADEVMTAAKDTGNLRALTGPVGIMYIFVDDADSAWTQPEMDAFLAEADKELARLLEDSRQWGVSLFFSQSCHYSAVSVSIDSNNVSHHMDAYLAGFGQDRQTANQVIADVTESAQGLPVFVFNKNGRACAIQSVDFECCFLFDNAHALRHELSHTFGAADFYYTDYIEEMANTHLPNSLMVDSVEGWVDELTAYLLGWTPNVTAGAQNFLNSISHLTSEDLAAASAANTYTGYGTLDYGNSTYEGYLFSGVPNDHGTVRWNDGTVFQGQFDHGVQTGWGCIFWPDGDYYEGDCENYTMHGTGTLTFVTGEVMSGTWENGEFLG